MIYIFGVDMAFKVLGYYNRDCLDTYPGPVIVTATRRHESKNTNRPIEVFNFNPGGLILKLNVLEIPIDDPYWIPEKSEAVFIKNGEVGCWLKQGIVIGWPSEIRKLLLDERKTESKSDKLELYDYLLKKVYKTRKIKELDLTL